MQNNTNYLDFWDCVIFEFPPITDQAVSCTVWFELLQMLDRDFMDADSESGFFGYTLQSESLNGALRHFCSFCALCWFFF